MGRLIGMCRNPVTTPFFGRLSGKLHTFATTHIESRRPKCLFVKLKPYGKGTFRTEPEP